MKSLQWVAATGCQKDNCNFFGFDETDEANSRGASCTWNLVFTFSFENALVFLNTLLSF